MKNVGLEYSKMDKDITPLKDFYNFIKILFGICLALALIIFTVAFSIGLAFKILERF